MSYNGYSDQAVLLEDPSGKYRKGNGCCTAPRDPTVHGLVQGWWQNFLLAAILGVTIALLATSGGTAVGLMMSGPMMEKTSNATLGMRRDTQKMVKGVQAWWFGKMLAPYPENQDQIWLKRADSITHSVEVIMGSVARSTVTKGFDINSLATTGIKSLVAEFIEEETKQEINRKIKEVVRIIEPAELAAAIKNFNKLSQTALHAAETGVVENANQLIHDVDESVKAFQNGKKITLEAKM